MKSTGIVRRIDDLGRVVVPKEMRRNLHIRDGDPLELFVDGDVLCFKKYTTADEMLLQKLDDLKTLIEIGEFCSCVTTEEKDLINSVVDFIKSKRKGDTNAGD